LRGEGGEGGGVSRVDVSEICRRRLARAGIGGGAADLEAVARSGEDDAARGINIEEIRREKIGRGRRGGNAIPIDLAPQAAERTIRTGSSAAAEVRAKLIAGGRDRRDRRIPANGSHNRSGEAVERQTQDERRKKEDGQASGES
jgi:hypothetical protein